MIVREITDQLAWSPVEFDYFNDYKDTRDWLESTGNLELMVKLDHYRELDSMTDEELMEEFDKLEKSIYELNVQGQYLKSGELIQKQHRVNTFLYGRGYVRVMAPTWKKAE